MNGQIFTPPLVDGKFEQLVTFTTEGPYNIVATATNEAMNSTSVPRNIIYDIKPPVLGIDSVVSPTTLISQTITGTREAGIPVTVTCPTAVIGPISYLTAITWQMTLSGLSVGDNPITAVAVDLAGNPKSVTTAITRVVIPPLVITTTPPMPNATVGTLYNQQLTATGGTPSYTWNLQPGSSLPFGISLTNTGVISGTPSTAGISSFTVIVTDSKTVTATKLLSITVAASSSKPDLVVTSVSGPSSGTSGKTISVTITVKNQGGASAASSTASVYLSTYNVISDDDDDDDHGDIFVGDIAISSLSAGQSKTVTSSLTIPSTITAARYYIGAIADRKKVVSESNEENNSKTGNRITVDSGDDDDD
jgi:hypothetical protein